jgi:hypothetical protein
VGVAFTDRPVALLDVVLDASVGRHLPADCLRGVLGTCGVGGLLAALNPVLPVTSSW